MVLKTVGESKLGRGTQRTRPRRRECEVRAAVRCGGAGKLHPMGIGGSKGAREEYTVRRLSGGIGEAILHRRVRRRGRVETSQSGGFIGFRTNVAGEIRTEGPI